MQKSLRKFTVLMMAAILVTGMQSCKIEGPDQDDVVKYQATIDSKNTIPRTTSSAQGSALLEYNKTTRMLTYSVTYQGLTPTEGGIYKAQPAWETGPKIIPFNTVASSPVTGSLILGNEEETLLRLGNLYINLITKDNPYGEIRGQILPVPINEP